VKYQSIDFPRTVETDSADSHCPPSAALICTKYIRAEVRMMEEKEEVNNQEHPPWCSTLEGKECDCDLAGATNPPLEAVHTSGRRRIGHQGRANDRQSSNLLHKKLSDCNLQTR
jgi:hypothetical protein